MPFTTFLIQIAIVTCITIYALIYLLGVKRGIVKPVLATWIFFSVATVLSFITDFSDSGMQGLLANSFNIIDMFACLLIFAVVLGKKDTRKRFTIFEKGCLGTVILIFVGWIVSGQNVLAHLCLQIMLVIAYLPTLVHLWHAQKNTESLSMWSLNALASFFGVIEPARAHAILPLVYGIRAIVSTLAVILLIVRLRWRNNRA